MLRVVVGLALELLVLGGMTITKQAGWKAHSVRRGVTIYRRASGTGTSQGAWMVANTTFDTLAQARDYVDSLRAGTVIGNGQVISG